MILANWLRRVSEEPHSSPAPSRLAEALLLPWSVSMSSDEPYWRPPTPRSVWSFSWRLMVSKPVSGWFPVLPTTPRSIIASARNAAIITRTHGSKLRPLAMPHRSNMRSGPPATIESESSREIEHEQGQESEKYFAAGVLGHWNLGG